MDRKTGFKCVTWSVDGQTRPALPRMHWLVEIISKVHFDVVCLQGVTWECMQYLTHHLGGKEGVYTIVPDDRKLFAPVCEVIMSLHPITNTDRLDFSAGKSEDAVYGATIATVKMPAPINTLTVVSTQLCEDSHDQGRQVRYRQQKQLFNELKRERQVLLGIDTHCYNDDGDGPDDLVSLKEKDNKEWKDAWMERGRPGKFQWTVDGHVNTAVLGKDFSARYDRMLWISRPISTREPDYYSDGDGDDSDSDRSSDSDESDSEDRHHHKKKKHRHHKSGHKSKSSHSHRSRSSSKSSHSHRSKSRSSSKSSRKKQQPELPSSTVEWQVAKLGFVGDKPFPAPRAAGLAPLEDGTPQKMFISTHFGVLVFFDIIMRRARRQASDVDNIPVDEAKRQTAKTAAANEYKMTTQGAQSGAAATAADDDQSILNPRASFKDQIRQSKSVATDGSRRRRDDDGDDDNSTAALGRTAIRRSARRSSRTKNDRRAPVVSGSESDSGKDGDETESDSEPEDVGRWDNKSAWTHKPKKIKRRSISQEEFDKYQRERTRHEPKLDPTKLAQRGKKLSKEAQRKLRKKMFGLSVDGKDDDDSDTRRISGSKADRLLEKVEKERKDFDRQLKRDLRQELHNIDPRNRHQVRQRAFAEYDGRRERNQSSVGDAELHQMRLDREKVDRQMFRENELSRQQEEERRLRR